MNVTPKVYWTRFGTIVSSTEFVKAIHKIVTNVSLTHWGYESHAADFSEIVLKCNVAPNTNMRFKLKKHATASYCVGQLSINGGSNWSPESRMVGANSAATFTNADKYKINSNSKIYLVEVEDAIFLYTTNAVGGSLLRPNSLSYSVSAGILFQPQDFSNYCKGYAIFGGVPAASRGFAVNNNNANYPAAEPYKVASLLVDNPDTNLRSSFALYNNNWIKIKARTTAETANLKFGDSNSIESLLGMNLYQSVIFPNNSGHLSGPFIGTTKYMRITNDTSVTNDVILNYPTTSPDIGWKKNSFATVHMNNLGLIWCKNESDEFFVS